jgi:hypothetical protein
MNTISNKRSFVPSTAHIYGKNKNNPHSPTRRDGDYFALKEFL